MLPRPAAEHGRAVGRVTVALPCMLGAALPMEVLISSSFHCARGVQAHCPKARRKVWHLALHARLAMGIMRQS